MLATAQGVGALCGWVPEPVRGQRVDHDADRLQSPAVCGFHDGCNLGGDHGHLPLRDLHGFRSLLDLASERGEHLHPLPNGVGLLRHIVTPGRPVKRGGKS